MKKVILSFGIMVLIGLFLLIGCGVKPDNQTTGEIDAGYRVIAVSKGFSDNVIKVNRGEEVKIIYSGKTDGVSMNLPDFDVNEKSDGKIVETIVKMKEEGEFELITTENNSEERGTISVQVFVNETTFINATPEAFEQAMVGDYFLLDVRTQEEYDEVNIDGATLISVYELQERLDEIEQYKDIPVLVYCRSGNRSIVASQILIDEEFKKVYNLNGGISGWLDYKN